MQLQTLRELALPGSVLERPKPLLLLCYLALEGPKERRFLAELFWPTSEKSLASLSTTLYRINHEAPEAIQSDETRVWTQLKTDTQFLLSSIQQESFDPSLYTGAFLQGFYVADVSEELEEWILQTRESLALKVQRNLLKQAEKMAALGQFAEASERTEVVLKLPGAAELEPEDLLRCYPLMLATEHPLVTTVQKQLEDYGIKINLSSHEARSRLRQVFVGRSREIETLSALNSGEWAWLKAGVGLGKTSLLQQLPGRYLSGHVGLPYATLEPLVGEAVQNGAEAVLRRLSRQEGLIKLDNWEQTDPESQEIFKRLKSLKGDFKVVITSTQTPAFAIDKILELSPLSNQDLENDLWKRTGGVPNLVSAYMRGEPLPQALASTLHHLSETARYLYLSLALLEEPDVGLARRGLKLSAGDLAKALEELMGAGLAQVSGRVWPREVAREYLKSYPSLLSQFALPLARVLENNQALPLYQITKILWTDEDIPKIQEAYLSLAQETLQRGFPKRAVEIVDEVPLNDDLKLLKARALENIGLYKKALEVLGEAKLPEAKAFKGRLLWKLGEPEQALKIASQFENSKNVQVRAEALLTLGLLNWSIGEFITSEENFRRASALWQTTNKRDLWAEALNGMALARMDSMQPIERVEEKLIEAGRIAGNNPFLKVRLLLNRATTYQKHQQFQEAIEGFKKTIPAAQAIGAKEVESRAWNNMGVCFHLQNMVQEAQYAYEQSLALVRELGETLMIGTTLANITELTHNRDGWEEAIRILEEGGHHAAVKRLKSNPPSF